MAKIEQLQFITNGTTVCQIISEVTHFLNGGGRWVQLRMKDADDALFLDTAHKIKALCNEYGAQLIINDRIDICKAVDCAGVHLGKSDATVEQARAVLGVGKIVGRTCNTAQDILSALEMEVDYLGVGPLRFTTTKKLLSPVIGIEGYRDFFDKVSISKPIIAVGGIITEDIELLLEAGVHGVAVSGLIAKSTSPKQTTQEILNIIKNYK